MKKFLTLKNLTKYIDYFIKRSMSAAASVRYFPNSMTDSSADESVSSDFLKDRISNILNLIKKNVQPIEKNAADGLYLGTAGISYMYYHLSKIPSLGNFRNEFLNMSLNYIKPAINVALNSHIKTNDVPSFILGNSGIYALAAVIFHKKGDQAQSDQFRKLFYEVANTCKIPNFLKCGSDELFVGRTGYVQGALWLSKETETELQKTDIYNICQVMIDSGRKYASKNKSPCPLMYAYYQVEYLGAAHGLCTILQTLLSVPGFLNANPGNVNDIKASVDYLLSIQDKEGNFPSAIDEIGNRNILVHWCHGAGGMIYLMAKAYLIWKDNKYLTSCVKMADLIWSKGLLKKGPGICHGVAGNGYAFLLMYRLTGQEDYLSKAMAFAKFMDTDVFKKGARTPDCPFSLYEGIAGTACFLADISCPSHAAFPFSDVF